MVHNKSNKEHFLRIPVCNYMAFLERSFVKFETNIKYILVVKILFRNSTNIIPKNLQKKYFYKFENYIIPLHHNKNCKQIAPP